MTVINLIFMNALTSLFNKRMSRKEFLQTVGIISLSIVGLGMFVRSADAAQQMGSATPTKPNTTDTYGS